MIAAELPDADPARPRVYAEALVGASERIAVRRGNNPSMSPDRLAAGVMDVTWLGFAGLRRGARWRG